MLALKEIREKLHQMPELAFQEHKTKAFIKSQIEALLQTDTMRAQRFNLHEFHSSTGMLLDYRAVANGAYKLFRADMDALPLQEDTGVDFASRHAGIMHACGHDLHITVLLGLIQKVFELQPAQNLLFLFQPAEEGEGGAQSVLAEGLIDRFPVQSVYALHVSPNLPVGTISSKAGSFFAIPQEFDLVFTGKAAHVAFPEKGIDAIAAAVDFLSELKSAKAALERDERLIIHVGKIQGGQIRNVIADSCVLHGTHRTLSTETKERVNQLLEELSQKCAQKNGAAAQVKLLGSYDAVVNDADLYLALKQGCARLNYEFIEAETVMTGEDFGFFTTRYPGLLFWLGGGIGEPLHSPRFLADAAAIEVGVEVFYSLI